MQHLSKLELMGLEKGQIIKTVFAEIDGHLSTALIDERFFVKGIEHTKKGDVILFLNRFRGSEKSRYINKFTINNSFNKNGEHRVYISGSVIVKAYGLAE